MKDVHSAQLIVKDTKEPNAATYFYPFPKTLKGLFKSAQTCFSLMNVTCFLCTVTEIKRQRPVVQDLDGRRSSGCAVTHMDMRGDERILCHTVKCYIRGSSWKKTSDFYNIQKHLRVGKKLCKATVITHLRRGHTGLNQTLGTHALLSTTLNQH